MASQSTAPLTNGLHVDSKTVEAAISLPHSPGLVINIHLTELAKTTMLFASCQSIEGNQTRPSMGSLVYAMPDRYNSQQPICTALYTATPSIDFATRMARLLVRRLNKPCYVGSSISLTTSPAGVTVEEEMEAFQSIVKVVLEHAEVAK